MEKQEQEELKSRRNVAAKQGQRTRQKDCEERKRGTEKGVERVKQGISATRESECCIYFPPEQGTQLVAAGLSLPSIR